MASEIIEQVDTAAQTQRERLIEMFGEVREMREQLGIPSEGGRCSLMSVLLYALAQLINEGCPWEGDPFREAGGM